jgi:hypothetical protein
MREVSSAVLRLMPPTAWYFGSAPLYMTWMFLIVGGLAWFPGVDSESLVVAPFTVVAAQVCGYVAIRFASARLAPLFQRIGLLIVTTLFSSVGVCGACFVALGLLDNFWLQPCIALGAAASVPLQQAWIEFYSSLERNPSIVSHAGSTFMAFSLSLLLMGFVTPLIPVLATFILVCSGFFTLIAGFMSWTGGGGSNHQLLITL